MNNNELPITNDNELKAIKKSMKKIFNKLGVALLMHELVIYIAIFASTIVFTIIQGIMNPNASNEQLNQILKQPSIDDTIGIISICIAFIPILRYRGKQFFQYDLKVENKKFTAKTIIKVFIILLSINCTLGLFTDGLEFGLNKIGLSAVSALNDLEILNEPTILMVIYSCIIAPVLEEFTYRGAVLRSLEKYGRWFAILVSAMLFGLMHGNFYQIFMATGVGIILGYLAIEYSIKLTIILHICNNTFVQVLSQVNSHIGENAANIIDISMSVIFIIILVVTLIYKKNYIKEWLQINKMENGIMLRFLTSIAIIILVTIDLLMVVSGIERIS